MIYLLPVGFTSKVLKALIFSITLVTAARAQAPVATVTSSGPFELRGANVTPGQGVPSWPGLAGDTIKAGNTPVTVTFPDGSTILLNPGSSAKLGLSGQTPVFQLTSGSASYSLKTLTAVKLMAAAKVVTPSDMAGLLELGGSNLPKAGFWTAGHTTAVLLGAGAATGLGVGIAKATGGGASVSPSQ
jgi:hypothetical protein